MKVCYIAVLDRVVKYFFEPQMNAFCEAKNEVTCITNFSDVEFRNKLDSRVKTMDINICRNVNPFNLVKNIIKLTRIFKKERYDIIQFTGPSTSLICSIAGRLAKVKTRIYCLWGVRYEGFSGLKRKIFRFLEKLSCKNSTNIIFDSEYNRNLIIKEKVAKENKTHVVLKGSACGIDLNTYNIQSKRLYNEEIRTKYDIPKDAFVFGYLGRMSYEKGINELLFVMRTILSKDKNTYLLVVGFIDEEKELDNELLNWAKGEKRVIFTGRQDEPEKFYATFDLFVFPSYREGFGGGVVQAGAFAVPSVVSNIGPLVETIKNDEFGRAFQVKDRQALLELIGSIYENQQLLSDLGNKMLDYVKLYFDRNSWINEYKQYVCEAYETNNERR